MALNAEQVEAFKKAKDGLDVLDDIHRYAKLNDYSAIDPLDLERFKWYGLYKQKPNDGHFMVRIKIPGGQMTGHQLKQIGQLANDHGRGFGDVSTRQAIQLHWLTLAALPDLLDRIYNQMGFYQEFSCGDAPRNVTACPLAGLLTEDEEYADGRLLVKALSDMYRDGGKAFSNLPRKHKTAMSGCKLHCHAPQINDLGFFGVERVHNGEKQRGFGICVGGGLRDTPHIAQSLRVFLPVDRKLILDVAEKVVQIYRDQDSLRQGRLRARLKFYVAQVGWEVFRDQLEERLGYKLEHDDSIVGPVGGELCDHLGVGELKNGLKYVGIPIPRGRLTGDQMIRVGELAAECSADPVHQVNATIKQNLILLNIMPEKVDALLQGLAAIDLPVETHPVRRQLLSCTGTQFCNLAVVETKERALGIMQYLEANVPMARPIFVSVTGCPNSCAHYQIADIGLQGTLYIYKGQKGVEHYHVLVGGTLGEHAEFGRFVCDEKDKKLKVPADLVYLAIERLIKAYQADGAEAAGVAFANWSRKQEMSRLAELITVTED